MTKYLTALFLLMSLSVGGLPAAAQDIPDDPAVELIGPVRVTEDGFLYALRIDLPDGWHTYWRDPGEVGVPPRFNWSGSTGIEEIAILWPEPEQLIEDGFRVNGYHGRVILPLILIGPDPRPHLVLDYAICDHICIPLTVTVHGARRPDGEDIRQIDEALSQVPEKQ